MEDQGLRKLAELALTNHQGLAGELHRQVVEIVQEAITTPSGGQKFIFSSDELEQIGIAVDVEEQAAGLLRPLPDNEPARSLFHLLAAYLAAMLSQFDRAHTLAIKGLMGSPPPYAKRKLTYIREACGVLIEMNQSILREMPALFAES